MAVINIMKKLIRCVSALVLFFLGAFTLANEYWESEIYGPYTAVIRGGEIIRDLEIAGHGSIYPLLNLDHKEKEILLKNSNFFKSGYRNCFDQTQKFFFPVNQWKAPNEYAGWVETSGNYVAYYIEGKLILRLAKTEAPPRLAKIERF